MLSMIQAVRYICVENITRVLGKVFKKERPLMRCREIEIIEELLKNLQPKNCLEWGAGYSTTFFPRFLDKNAKWSSIEHDKRWYTKIEKMNKNHNSKVFYIPPNRSPRREQYGDGSFTDFKDYIEFPKKFGRFDFILVDGRARKHCLIKAHNLIKNKGIVVLHDANRKQYHGPFNLYKHQILFKDYRKEGGGLWLGSKNLRIEQVLDVERHLEVWRQITKIGKIIRWV